MGALTLIKPGAARKNNLQTNKGVSLGDLKLGLYVNNITPSPGDDGTTYLECSLAGYAQITLTGASWSTPSYSAGVTSTVYPNVTFTFTGGGQTIYGVLLFDTAGGIDYTGLLDTPFTVPGPGGSLTITNLTIQDK